MIVATSTVAVATANTAAIVKKTFFCVVMFVTPYYGTVATPTCVPALHWQDLLSYMISRYSLFVNMCERHPFSVLLRGMIERMKFQKFLVATLLMCFPLATHAQASIQMMLIDFEFFVGDVIMPVLLAIAVLFFIWNAIRFFILQGSTDEGRDKAKQFMLYGLGAMVLIVGVWGFVRFGLQIFGLRHSSYICPDYVPGCDDGSFGANEGYDSSSFEFFDGF